MSEMGGDNSFIAILRRMQARLVTEADKREGTWTADNLQAVANELARIYSEEIEDILPQAFIVTATGTNLDRACSDYGIERRAATQAAAVLTVTGKSGSYSGVEAYAGEIVFLLDDFVIPQDGASVSVRAVCTTYGAIGNVAAGSITEAGERRITAVTNEADAEGGYDREDDETFRARALEHIRTPAVSGNIAHYIQWAKEVPGVQKVRVFDLPRGNGTVDVVLIADGNESAPDSLVEAVAAHIEAVRPIGADVLVTGAEAVGITVEASVLVQEGYTAQMVREHFDKLLSAYCESLAFTSPVISYLGVASLLFDVSGVADVESYTVNGGQESIRLTERQFPAARPSVITVQEIKEASDA